MLVASQVSAIHAEEAAAMRQNSQHQFHGEKAAEPEPGKVRMDRITRVVTHLGFVG